MTVCCYFREAIENNLYTLGAVDLPLRERKNTKAKKERSHVLNKSAQLVKSSVVVYLCAAASVAA